MTTKFPWSRPSGKYKVYQTDGPDKPVEFNYGNAHFRVSPANANSIHTGRGRFHVECLTCDVLLHYATAGPATRVNDHARGAHRERKP